MTAKSKSMVLKKTLMWRKEKLSRVLVLKTAALLVYFFLGFVGGCARVFDVINPFGVAMTSCCGGGAGGLASLVGASAGYVLTGDPLWSIRYLAALVLVYTVAFVFRSNERVSKEWFMPLVAGAFVLVSGVLCYFDSLN